MQGLAKAIRSALALLAAFGAGCAQAPPPPDVILVIIDTLRADRLGAYGSESGATPFLDEWAEGSIVFRRAYAHSPWTTPSMASLLTSRYPSQHGVVSLDSLLVDSERTFPEILAEHGYATGGVTANWLVHDRRGFGQGYQHHEALVLEGEALLTPTVGADEVGQKALAWVDGLPEPRPPVLLYLHFMEPHTPYDPPRPTLDYFFRGDPPPDLEDLSRRAVLASKFRPSPQVIEDVKRAYDAELMALDGALRRLFVALEHRGLLENALVVVTSDHGEELGDRGSLGHGHTLYEELIHVPLLLRRPGQTRGADVHTAVSHVDLAPTLLDYAGIEAPPRFEGESLRPLAERALAGDSEPPREPRPIFVELDRTKPDLDLFQHRRAVVRGDEKIVETPDGERRFYSLAGDPEERHPDGLTETSRAELETLLERMTRSFERDATPRRTEPLDEETRERLRGLGYVE